MSLGSDYFDGKEGDIPTGDGAREDRATAVDMEVDPRGDRYAEGAPKFRMIREVPSKRKKQQKS